MGWVTLQNGTHIRIGANGVIEAGPSALTGRHVNDLKKPGASKPPGKPSAPSNKPPGKPNNKPGNLTKPSGNISNKPGKPSTNPDKPGKPVSGAVASSGSTQTPSGPPSSPTGKPSNPAPTAKEKPKTPSFKDTDHAAKWATEKLGGWAKTLTPKEHDALGVYQGDGYKEINGACRTGEAAGDRFEFLGRTVTHLDAAIKRAVLPAPVTVYRGIHDASFLGDFDALVGKTISDKGYTSTSMVSKVADEGFQSDKGASFQIHLPKGTPAASLAAAGAVAGAEGEVASYEAELLLPRNAPLKILSVDRSKKPPLIHAEYTLGEK